MGATRAKFSPDFIAEVALAAIRGEMTINEIASQFDVYGNQVVRWKKQAVAELAEVFSDKPEKCHAFRLSGEILRKEHKTDPQKPRPILSAVVIGKNDNLTGRDFSPWTRSKENIMARTGLTGKISEARNSREYMNGGMLDRLSTHSMGQL